MLQTKGDPYVLTAAIENNVYFTYLFIFYFLGFHIYCKHAPVM